MKKRLLFLLYSLLLFAPASLYAQEYSLNDLYEIALERSEVLRIAEEDFFIAEREKDQALAQLLPSISAFGYHTRFKDAQFSSGFLVQPDYTNEWGLRLDQTYSLGGREFTNYGITKQGIIKSGYDLHSTREAFLLDISTQYYDVLRGAREAEIATANVERLKKHRDAAKKRLEVGEAIKTDLLRAEAELADAETELIRAKNTLRVLKNSLAESVGITGSYDLKEPVTEIDFGSSESEPDLDFLPEGCALSVIECLKEMALSERAELQSLIMQKRIAEEGVKAARSSYWPDLSIEGEYFNQRNVPSRSFELEESISGAVRLDFPFFEGGLTRARVAQAKAQLRQAELNLAELERRITVGVENSYINVLTESSVTKKTMVEVEFASENYDLVSKQFKYGLANSVDVIDANTRLVSAERQLVNARYVYQLSLIRLKRATGVLLSEVIGKQVE